MNRVVLLSVTLLSPLPLRSSFVSSTKIEKYWLHDIVGVPCPQKLSLVLLDSIPEVLGSRKQHVVSANMKPGILVKIMIMNVRTAT